MELKSIITISGRINSGKSYAAELIRDKLDIPIGSFGDYIKYRCEQDGFSTDRKHLQDMGESFVEANSQQFLLEVISHSIGSADKIILEGVRHRSIFNGVSALTKNHIAIFVSADLGTRYERFKERNKASNEPKTFEQFVIFDNHPVELEIETLKPFCYIVINSTEDYSDELFEFLSPHLCGP